MAATVQSAVNVVMVALVVRRSRSTFLIVSCNANCQFASVLIFVTQTVSLRRFLFS